MAREARQRSKTGIYHLVSRGISQQNIFLDDDDRIRYLHLLKHLQNEYDLSIHAYCLMSNHVHLLVAEGKEAIGESMRRIGVSYATCFNRKHGRVGYVFQGRFHSEVVEDDSYFLTVLRYILHNPVKAGLCREINGYPWSSHYEYTGGRGRVPGLVTTDLATGIMGGPKRLLHFLRQTPPAQEEDSGVLEVVEIKRIADREVQEHLQQLLPNWDPTQSLANLERAERRRMLEVLKAMPGASILQIARVTGMSKGIVERG